jgi:two-component system, NtrC family, response regulator PilR
MAWSSSSTTDIAARKPAVLVIDDEPDLRTLYELSLTREGYEVETADTVAQSLSLLAQRSFQAIVSDMQLPDGLGLEVLRFLSRSQRSERCVVITAHGSAENAVEALKAGAFDYLTKPVDLKQFRSVVAQAILSGQQTSALVSASPSASVSSVSPAPSNQAPTPAAQLQPTSNDAASMALRRIVGDSEVMTALRARIAKVARSMAPVLVHGESGTGKELVARAIHACSHRSEGPFVAVNCSAIPEHLLEAEFFGARKGSYTGAVADREGFFQAAHDGTLFLDEIGDLPLSMQAKLLRAIQERSVRALGDTAEQAVNVRIVSATHRDLPAAVAAGQFRQDLFYRINVIDMTLPPLRGRREDLPQLVNTLLARIAQDSGLPAIPASAQFLAQLQSLPLPGNVRELENLLHRAVALSDGHELSLDTQGLPSMQDLTPSQAQALAARSSSPIDSQVEPDTLPQALPASDLLPSDLQAHLDEQERQILIQALRETGFNRTAAGAKLGMNLRQIRYRMARLGIDAADDTKP